MSAVGGTMSDGRIAEGSDVTYKCHGDANPPEVTYRWYINEELVIGDFTTEMVSAAAATAMYLRRTAQCIVITNNLNSCVCASLAGYK